MLLLSILQCKSYTAQVHAVRERASADMESNEPKAHAWLLADERMRILI